jgi:hypothetical protein
MNIQKERKRLFLTADVLTANLINSILGFLAKEEKKEKTHGLSSSAPWTHPS